MKKIVMVAVVAGLFVGGQVFAYSPYVNGHKTIAVPEQSKVVIGGQVYDVTLTPSTVEEGEITKTFFEAQVYDALNAQSALKATSCDK